MTSPATAVVAYSLRACAAGRRVVLLLPLAAALLFGMLSRLPDAPAVDAFASVGGAALHTLVLPIACLVIGDAVLGAEVRSGVFTFTWLSPVSWSTIVLGRWVGGSLVATALLAPAVALAALAAGVPGSAGAAVVAAVAGSAAYLAVFVAVGATFRRPVVWSLALVILVERLLGAALDAVAQVSPGWLSQAVLLGLTDADASLRREGVPSGWGAVGRLALVAAVALVVATRRLRRLRPAAASD